ncbi:MAG TPA: class I SAM-dependent methyltransferase [Chitinispirillaceae bacterium]|nr:class I SAM-dependent methyltransferase [Chitinispirillaceae bacterium]
MYQFDFGKNWASFSRSALSTIRIETARNDFNNLFSGIPLKGKTFLDIGFGQGLSLLFANEAGAVTVGNDINPSCYDAINESARFFNLSSITFPLILGSILENTTIENIQRALERKMLFDIVHSWGVLHHTGGMYDALSKAMNLVARGGYFVIAIYNYHYTSLLWRFIKLIYCKSHPCLKKLMITVFYPLIAAAKFAVTGKNPFKKDRGMNFYYDVIDWIGGYPYEYASKQKIINYCEEYGFTCIRCVDADVPTGCNQFVFYKSR